MGVLSFDQIVAAVDNGLLSSLSDDALAEASYGILFRKDPDYIGAPHPPLEFPGETYEPGQLDRLDAAIWNERAVRHERECAELSPVDQSVIADASWLS